ncbi:hypothetical protein PVAP13_1NG320719 [Panicum virgatum]|uniref:Uncharacterized protein n=1 Tax=Panicum virgatum TaxID=38727 RepID=A0A8T0X8M9_PANVG|nr:hypothetical protein PVAP13_1NG320719 [Panicum virgatum]
MPTITHYVLDPFLETGSPAQVQKAASKPPPPPPPHKATPVPVVPVRTQTSPASLYATPESTTLPDSPSSFPGTWSPYIINHKRRGASLAKTLSQVQEPEFAFQQVGIGQAERDSGLEEPLNGQDGLLQKVEGSVAAKIEQAQPEFEFQRGSLEASVRPVNVGRPSNGGAPKNAESDAFVELQDSMSVTSNNEADDVGMHEQWWKPSSPLGTSVGTPGAEFYDAFEGGSKQKEALENWQTEWMKLSQHLSRVALSLPYPSIAENTDDSSLLLSLAHAEVESEMETVIAAKNFEIARLSDRVQYYEAANREMSQRNQEAIEMSRQQRKERKKRQKLFWGSVGLAVTLGATAIAWSYLPSSQPHASADSNSPSSE